MTDHKSLSRLGEYDRKITYTIYVPLPIIYHFADQNREIYILKLASDDIFVPT